MKYYIAAQTNVKGVFITALLTKAVGDLYAKETEKEFKRKDIPRLEDQLDGMVKKQKSFDKKGVDMTASVILHTGEIITVHKNQTECIGKHSKGKAVRLDIMSLYGRKGQPYVSPVILKREFEELRSLGFEIDDNAFKRQHSVTLKK